MNLWEMCSFRARKFTMLCYDNGPEEVTKKTKRKRTSEYSYIANVKSKKLTGAPVPWPPIANCTVVNSLRPSTPFNPRIVLILDLSKAPWITGGVGQSSIRTSESGPSD